MPTIDEVERLKPYFQALPNSPYPKELRKKTSTDLTNRVAEFEEAKSTPYSFGGSPGGFSISLGSGSGADSTNFRHSLYIYQNGSATSSYVQWSSSTAQTVSYWTIAIENTYVYQDIYWGELRFWDVQSPGAADKYYALRFKSSTTGIQMCTFFGTGITFNSLADGTSTSSWMPWHMSTRPFIIKAFAQSGPYGQFNVYPFDAVRIPSWSAGLSPGAGYPVNMKCIRWTMPASLYVGVVIDRISVGYTDF